MIKVTAKCFIKKEFIEDFKACTSKLIAETKREEGCLSYELYQDTTDETIFSFIEEWKDMKSLECHMNSSHCREVFPKMEKLFLKDMEVNFYTLVE